MQRQLFEILKWRDNVYRDIIKKIEMIPGLNDLIDQLTNALNACPSFSIIMTLISDVAESPL